MNDFITVFGNGGEFKVNSTTGLAYDHEPSDEVTSGDHEGYGEVEWVDLEEHRAFWGHMHGHIDILDVRVRFKDGTIEEAEADWRRCAKEGIDP
ncbi:hypothetical protein [Mesorhizobium sp. M0767]|uniref:hypothetical protein n=1 Tax=Mesorhizobium sp. M0767 TaxID=2956995 RepID=UPI00333C7954